MTTSILSTGVLIAQLGQAGITQDEYNTLTPNEKANCLNAATNAILTAGQMQLFAQHIAHEDACISLTKLQISQILLQYPQLVTPPPPVV